MTSEEMPGLHSERPSNAHLCQVLLSRLSDEDWVEAIQASPTLRVFMTRGPRAVRNVNANSARVWLSQHRNGELLPEMLSLYTNHVAQRIRDKDPALKDVVSHLDDQRPVETTLSLGRAYLEQAAKDFGRGCAIMMLLGQQCMDGRGAPIGAAEDQLLVEIDAWADDRATPMNEGETTAPSSTVTVSESPTGLEREGSPAESAKESDGLDTGPSSGHDAQQQMWSAAGEGTPDLLVKLEASQNDLETNLRKSAEIVANGRLIPDSLLSAATSWNEVLAESAREVSTLAERPVDSAVEAVKTAYSSWLETSLRAELEQRERDERRQAQIQRKVTRLEEELQDADLLAAEDIQRLQDELSYWRARLNSGITQASDQKDSKAADEHTPASPVTDERAASPERDAPPGTSADTQQSAAPIAGASDQPGEATRDSATEEMADPSAASSVDAAGINRSDGEPGRAREDGPTFTPHTINAQEALPQPEIEVIELLAGMAQLVREGRTGHAYWISRLGLGEHAPTSEALRYLTASMASDARGIPAAEVTVDATERVDLVQVSADPNLAKVVVAATLRTALVAGYVGNEDLLTALLDDAGLTPSWRLALDTAIVACRAGYRRPLAGPDSVADVRDVLRSEAVQLLASLSRRRLSYHRATKLLHRMSHPEAELGRPLSCVIALATEPGNADLIGEISSFLDGTSSSSDIDRFIAAADRVHFDPVRGIEGRALKALHAQVESVRLLVQRAQAMGGTSSEDIPNPDVTESTHSKVLASFKAATTDSDGLGDSALMLVRGWVCEPHATDGDVGTISELLRRESLFLSWIDRDAGGIPMDSPRGSLEQALASLEFTDSGRELVAAYLAKGDIASATEIATRTPYEGASDEIDKSILEWSARFQRQIAEVEGRLNRARALGSADALFDSELPERLQRVRDRNQAIPDRFDFDMRLLAEIQRDLTDALAAVKEPLLDRLSRLAEGSADGNDIARIHSLLDEDDLVTAQELISLLDSGESLTALPQPTSPELSDLKALLQVRQVAPSFDDLLQVAGGAMDGVARASAGVTGWKTLRQPRQVSNPRNTGDSIRAVLRLLGLDVVPSSEVEDITSIERGRSGYRTFKVQATPNDGSIVPELGSLAQRHYRITLVNTPRPDVRVLLSAIDQQAGQVATLLLYTNVIDEASRRDLAALTRASDMQAIVVDDAVIALMASRYPGSFESVQRMTLPFSSYQFFTPSMAGELPDEVFFGRTRELQEIASTTGGMFVFGGRQLGKSSLLRRTQRQFSEIPDHIAIYIDLKARGIGESHDAEQLWPVLAEELLNHGVLRNRMKASDTILAKTRDWLDEDSRRRVLVLLDEADRFLDADAQEKKVGRRRATFPVVMRLKELMQDTQRRFKVVFAGLHTVQRFQSIQNNPLAHGGADILVGPLDTAAARDLVRSPLEALGYDFESDDLLWRLLAFTNYVASLIQIVGLALVRHLHRTKQVLPGQPPVTITAADVDAVLGSRQVQAQLVDKFRLTLNLDPRYNVIALVLAWHSTSGTQYARYPADELLAECRDFWPIGFESLTRREFDRYLQEMQGLGVLIHEDRQVMLRSPNVVRMLGDHEQIERELQEAYDIERPYDYSPGSARRLLRQTGQVWERSPLTDQELTELLPQHLPAGLRVVVASRGTGIDRVPAALADAADMLDRKTQVITPSELQKELTEWAGMKPEGRPIPVLRASGDDFAAEQAIRLLGEHCKHYKSAAVVVLDQDHTHLITQTGVTEDSVVACGRWTVLGLRAWDHELSERSVRQRLVAASSGWPELVESAIQRTTEASEPREEVLSDIEKFPQDPRDAQRFLRDAGVRADDEDSLKSWADLTSAPGEVVDESVIELAGLGESDLKRLLILGVIDKETEGFRLDPVVQRCLASLR